MPIKGIFNRSNKKEHSIGSSNEFDKQILRINTLEVQIKKLLEFEKQFRVSMHGIAKGKKGGSSGNEQKNSAAYKYRQDMNSKDDGTIGNEYKKMNELSRRIEKLEKFVHGISPSQYDTKTSSISHERGSIAEKQLLRIVDQIVSEKLATEYNKLRQSTRPQEGSSEWQEESDSQINMRLLALEHSYIMVNEVQASLIKRMNELAEKHNELLKKWEETEGSTEQQNPMYKTLYIDKLYLDKYEQNNNFAQIGIRELSGALNIGATYGKDVIPKKISEEAKAEIEKMKAIKEDMEKQQMSTDEPDKPQTDESASDLTSIPLEEEEPFIDIDIDDDPNSDKDPF